MYVSLLVYGTSVLQGRQLSEGSQSTMLFEMPEQLFHPLILCILAPNYFMMKIIIKLFIK